MFDYIIRVVMKGSDLFPERTNWPALGGSLLAILGYADDIALTARSMSALQARMEKFAGTCIRAGMSVSSKTKLLHLYRLRNRSPWADAP